MSARRVVAVGYENAELSDIACITSTLDGASRMGADPPYDVSVAAPGGRAITCSSGLVLESQGSLERTVGELDTLIVSGGPGSDAAADDARLVGHVRRLALESRRVTGVAKRCGFGSAETLRQAFVSHYGVPPSRYRATQAATQASTLAATQAATQAVAQVSAIRHGRTARGRRPSTT